MLCTRRPSSSSQESCRSLVSVGKTSIESRWQTSGVDNSTTYWHICGSVTCLISVWFPQTNDTLTYTRWHSKSTDQRHLHIHTRWHNKDNYTVSWGGHTKTSRSNRSNIRRPKKSPPFYFSNNSCQKITDFNDFWCVKSWENLTSIACTFAHLTCIPVVYSVATLPWEIQKSHFQQYYSYILQIICYLRKKTVTPLPTTHEKCHHTTL